MWAFVHGFVNKIGPHRIPAGPFYTTFSYLLSRLLMAATTTLPGSATAAFAATASATNVALLPTASSCRTADTLYATFLGSYNIYDCSAENGREHKNQYHIFHDRLPSIHRLVPLTGLRLYLSCHNLPCSLRTLLFRTFLRKPPVCVRNESR